MSVTALLYMASMPFLAKHYSEKGRYYVWLIIVIGLIIPFRTQLDNAIVTVELPITTMIYSESMNRGSPIHFAASEYERLAIVEHFHISEILPTTANILNISWWQAGFMVWFVGAIASVMYHIIKHYRFMKMVRRWSEKITDKQILSLFQELKAEMGIKKRVSLYLCPFGSPMIIGLIHPKLFLPTKNLEQDELRFILRHELVHYKRKDLLYKYLVIMATAIHWFNPIIYLIARSINMLSEISCDAAVVKSTDVDTRQSYSETLIGVVQYQSKLKTALSTNFYGSKKGVKNRITSIMDIRKKRSGIIIACVIMVFTVGTGFIFTTTPVLAYSEENRAYAHSNETTTHYVGWKTINDIPIHTIENTNRNIQFYMYYMGEWQREVISQPANLSFQGVAKIAAEAIYHEFDFCIDGMAGYMGRLDVALPLWHGAIVSQELTTHSDGDELFTFLIDAVTGEVLSVMMNTIESPFLG